MKKRDKNNCFSIDTTESKEAEDDFNLYRKNYQKIHTEVLPKLYDKFNEESDSVKLAKLAEVICELSQKFKYELH